MMQPLKTHTKPAASALSAEDKLLAYLGERRIKPASAGEVFALTPDASTREYFRFPWKRGTAIAAVYAEPFDPQTLPFLDVTNLFLAAEIPVPNILEIDPARGIVIQEDLGDLSLRAFYETATEEQREQYRERAINLIARIQAATESAFARASIASKLAFDYEKLAWELNFFREHYFGSLRGKVLSGAENEALTTELSAVAQELAERPRVLCHRDFHSANLIVDPRGQLRVIDYQDARMGPATYDLVSLLLDRITAPPSLAAIREDRLYFLEERRAYGLESLDPDEFACEFRLMTVQRVLKAVGTFSFQTAVRGRGEVYAKYIAPMLAIVLQAAEWLDRYPTLQNIIRAELDL